MCAKDLDEKYYYEFVKGTSSKFWEITIKENTFIIKYGRIGSEGQQTVKKWDSPETALREATKLRESKEKKGYVLKIDQEESFKFELNVEELQKNKSDLNNRVGRILGFFENAYPQLLDKQGKREFLSFGNFTDDLFDQSIEPYFQCVLGGIESYNAGLPLTEEESEKLDPNVFEELYNKIPEDGFHDPKYDLNPNNGIEFVILNSLKETVHSTLSVEKIYPLFPEDFWIKVRRWITMGLDEYFLKDIFSHRANFSPETIDKIIDGAAKCIVAAGDPPNIWSVEDMLSHFRPVTFWTEKVFLPLLYLVFAENFSPCSYNKNTH